jgi:hypothetical protein
MTETETVTDAWNDRKMWGTGDLALFLDGSESSFTGMLLVLIAKAQSTPENFSRLELAFPRAVKAWKTWQSMSPTPTFRELREALDAAGEDEPRATAVALLERMREVRGHIEDMGEDERVFMLGALTGALESALGRG